jgi:hypothetical protein
MSQCKKYWDAIIEQYKLSGLLQPAFCKQHELSYNHFNIVSICTTAKKVERTAEWVIKMRHNMRI